MLQGAHTRKMSIPVNANATGDNVVVVGHTDRWLLIHELIGDFDVSGTLTIKAGTRILGSFGLDAGQGLSLTDEPGEDNRPRFECSPGENFILECSAGSTFKGSCHFSWSY